MPFKSSDTHDYTPLAATTERAWKLVITGGFGVGKTTLTGAISEIAPLRTEAEMTQASVGVDDLAATPQKSTTTVGLDFGRLSLTSETALYLFGVPGQQRFAFLWEHLFLGALGAVVLIDTRQRRLEDSFASLDRVEASKLPYVVAHNVFGEEGERHSLEEIHQALSLPPEVPLLRCDARDRDSVREVLVALVKHIMNTRQQVMS